MLIDVGRRIPVLRLVFDTVPLDLVFVHIRVHNGNDLGNDNQDVTEDRETRKALDELRVGHASYNESTPLEHKK